MKELKTAWMKKLLRKGMKEARECTVLPKPGTLFPLFTVELKNGWYYQVDFLNNCNDPHVIVFAFKPPRVYFAKTAEYYLSAPFKKKD